MSLICAKVYHPTLAHLKVYVWKKVGALMLHCCLSDHLRAWYGTGAELPRRYSVLALCFSAKVIQAVFSILGIGMKFEIGMESCKLAEIWQKS